MSRVKRSTPPVVNVMVTIDEEHCDQLDAMASRLEAAGMNVADKFLGGVIVGEVSSADFAKLQRIEGIKKIEEEPTFFADR